MNKDIISLPITKYLLTTFKAQLKYEITEIDLTSITGSDFISLNKDISEKYKFDNNYDIIDDFEFANKLLMKYVKFTYNDTVNQKVFNANSDIERFQTSHFKEYIEISKLYLNYIIQHLQPINSLMNKKVMKDEAELMQFVMQMLGKDDQKKFKQQLLQEIENGKFTEENKKKV